jgi:hypothetical protein
VIQGAGATSGGEVGGDARITQRWQPHHRRRGVRVRRDGDPPTLLAQTVGALGLNQQAAQASGRGARARRPWGGGAGGVERRDFGLFEPLPRRTSPLKLIVHVPRKCKRLRSTVWSEPRRGEGR